MKSESQSHHRRSIRLREFDYSQPGAYFVTIVVHNRACLFGEVVDEEMRLNEYGRIVVGIWDSLPARFPGVYLGAAVVMPNHFHGVLDIRATDVNSVGAIHELPLPDHRRMTLPLVVGYFKMNSAKQMNALRNTPGQPVWQRNYYEHILRDDEGYRDIHLYIDGNPANWLDDDENPAKAAHKNWDQPAHRLIAGVKAVSNNGRAAISSINLRWRERSRRPGQPGTVIGSANHRAYKQPFGGVTAVRKRSGFVGLNL